MDILKFIVIFALVGSAFGGGNSKCAELRSSFTALLQFSELIMDRMLESLTDVARLFPFLIKSHITHFNCRMNVTKNIIAIGAARFSGKDANYIYGIINGTIRPPFQDPLDCIELELLSFVSFDRNIKEKVLPVLSAKEQVSTINDSLTCAEIKAYVAPYTLATQVLAQTTTKNTLENVNNFESIGLKDIFASFYPNVLSCGITHMIDSLASIYNLNSSVAAAFLADPKQPAPYVLSCVPETLADIENAKIFINGLNQTVNSSNNTRSCKDVQEEFWKFSPGWNLYTTGLLSILNNMSQSHPILIPVIIDDYNYEMNVMVDFLANYTASILNASSDAVRSMLLGQSSIPSEYPYTCIIELVFTTNRITSLLNSTISEVRKLTQNSTVNATTCLEKYEIIKSYTSVLVDWQNSKINLASDAVGSFMASNTTNSFLDLFVLNDRTLSQKHSILGDFIGTVLNTDATSVTQHLECSSDPLDEEFTCVDFLIQIMDSLTSQALTNINTANFQNLLVPRIPEFKGSSP